MLSKKDIVFPVAVLVILTSISLLFLITYSGEFVKTYKLRKYGISTAAAVAGKKEISRPRFTDIFSGNESRTYLLTASYSYEGKRAECNLSVSRTTYQAFGKRDHFEIVYLPSGPDICTLPASLDLNFYVLMSVIGGGLFFLLLSAGFGFYIYGAFKKPSNNNQIKTTTRIELEKAFCPVCKNEMSEGFMPTVGGVSWRDMDEPVGMPTILNGLPGTTYWVKRPLLHAFHCKACRLITFKYGKS